MSLYSPSVELTVAMGAAREAGEMLLKYREIGFKIHEKGYRDFYTDADVASEAEIIRIIRDTFPTHSILAEEKHASLYTVEIPEHLWVIDPLDGTTNFAHGIPHYAVSIAYLHHGKVQSAVVYNPERFDWYIAERGAGAWYNDERLVVGQQELLSESLIGVGFNNDPGPIARLSLSTIDLLFEKGVHGIRRFGAASLDLAHVARGMYSGFFEYQLAPWDIAAGMLIVEEAGGLVTSCIGTPLPLAKSSVLATNGKIHKEILSVIDQVAGPFLVKE